MAKKSGTSSKKDEPAATAADSADATTAKEPEPPTEEKKLADEEGQRDEDEEPAEAPQSPALGSAPSLSQQSKARSTSFRKISVSAAGPLSPGMFSPEGETAPDIYRKQVGRIEELEKENKRLAKEASDAEKSWQKAEEQLADLREADGDEKKGGASEGEVGKLVRSCSLCMSCAQALWASKTYRRLTHID